MENEIKKLENLKILTARYCNTLTPSLDQKKELTPLKLTCSIIMNLQQQLPKS